MKRIILCLTLVAALGAILSSGAAADNGQQTCQQVEGPGVAITTCTTLTLTNALTGPPSPQSPADLIYYALSGNLSGQALGASEGLANQQVPIDSWFTGDCSGDPEPGQTLTAYTDAQGNYLVTLGYGQQDGDQVYSFRARFDGTDVFPATTSACTTITIPGTNQGGDQGGDGGNGGDNGGSSTPPPAPDQCSNLPGNQATVPAGYLPASDGTCFEPTWVMVCLQKPALRADGTIGTFFQILDSQWRDGANDPNSLYYKATPAIFVKGYGTMCNISDVFTYGGDPLKFKDAGYPVNETGDKTPDGVSQADWGAIYEYWTPTQ